MSILIKGMKMPTSCLRGGCPIDGASCSLWEDKYWKSPDEPYRKRHPKCPLIPVPPHGRLIDDDALYKTYQEICSDIACISCPFLTEDGCKVEQMIMYAPTIIEAEEGADHE